MLHTQVRDRNTVYNTVEDYVMDGFKEAGPTITGSITKNVPEAVMTTVATAVDQLDTLACPGLDLANKAWFLKTSINFLLNMVGMKLVEATETGEAMEVTEVVTTTTETMVSET